MRIHTLLFLLIMLLPPASATDRLVNADGTGAVFTTITAALNAAVDGDRLLIVPGIYDEPSIVLSKSLELVSAVRGQPFTLVDDITVEAAYGRTVIISGADVHGTLGASPVGPGDTGCTIVLCGCSFDHIDLVYSGVFLSAYQCTVRGQLGFSQGIVAGNTILGEPDLVAPQYSPLLYMGAATSTESRVVGNVIGSTAWEGSQSMVRMDTHAPLLFANNLVHWTRATPSASAITLTGNTVDGITTLGFTFLNNTVLRTTGTTQPWLAEGVPDEVPFSASLTNNLIVGGSGFIPQAGTSNVYTSAWNVITNGYAQHDPQTGTPLAGSAAIDAGDPDVTHLDLDLTRNDAGCYGGSYSRSNYSTPSANGAAIGLVTVPRRFGQLTPLPLTAFGLDH